MYVDKEFGIAKNLERRKTKKKRRGDDNEIKFGTTDLNTSSYDELEGTGVWER